MLTIGPAPGQASADAVLTREQVAEMFRVSPRTVQRGGPSRQARRPARQRVAKLLIPINSNTPQAAGRDARQHQ